MYLYSSDAVQIVDPGEDVIFTTAVNPCRDGTVRHRLGTAPFLLSGRSRCPRINPAYAIDFGANIAVNTGGTPGAISLGVVVDGSTVPASEMIVTPAAVEEYFNVSREIAVDIWAGCCETVAIRNLSDQQILVQNATIDIGRKEERYAR